MRKVLLLLLLSLHVLAAKADYKITPLCRLAWNSVSRFELDEAEGLLRLEREQHPDNDIVLLLENYIDFCHILASGDHKTYERLLEKRTLRLDLLEAGDDKSPYYRYCLGVCYQQWAVARAQYGDYVGAAFDLNRAYRYFSYNNKKFPLFLPNRLYMSVIESVTGMVPESLQWLRGIVLPPGSVQGGVNTLKHILKEVSGDNEWNILEGECLFFLSYISLNVLGDAQHAQQWDRWFEALPHWDAQPLLLIARARIAMHNARNDEAIIWLTQPRSVSALYMGYIDYLAGVALMNRLDRRAEDYFFRFIGQAPHASYRAAAWQRLAWCALVHHDIELYHDRMSRVISGKPFVVEADKIANRAVEDGRMPSVFLLKARLLYDGGYYFRATEILEDRQIQFLKNEEDSLEYSYRLGRVYEKTGDSSMALLHYLQTIEYGKESKHYYAANAALQVAHRYEQLGRIEEAVYYDEMVLKMPFKTYRTSIRQKARLHMNQLRKKNKVQNKR